MNKIIFYFIIVSSFAAQAQELGNGKISGEAFIDYFYNVSRDTMHSKLPNTALKGDRDFNAFEFRRIYFTYDYKFSSSFQSRVRFEANQQGATGSVNPFIKDLWIKWKNIFDGSDLIFGIQPTPTWQVSEDYWTFRALEKTIMDLRNTGSSRDLGITLKGKFDNDGMFGYWIMLANGSSTGFVSDKHKNVYAHINIAPMENMNITIYGDYKFRDRLTYTDNATQKTYSMNNDVITSAAFIGFNDTDYSFGVEGILQLTKNGFSTSSNNQTSFTSRNALGISVFGNVEVLDDASIVARYDYFDPNTKADYDSRNFGIFGISFQPEKNIRIIPNVLFESYEKVNSVSIDPSITARLTVHFVY